MKRQASPVRMKRYNIDDNISLFFFFCTGNFAIFQFFLDSKRYPIDLQDKDGNTLLHVLCRGKIDSKKQEAMIILLEAGANPLISNNQMKTPIDIVSNLR